jgi:TolB-like protein/Tfp pilus assembly protein PilF
MKRLINFTAVIIIVLLIAAVSFYILSPSNKRQAASAVPISSRESIAILPFTNLGKDSDQDYLSEGFAEDILNSLSRQKDVKINAGYSSFKFSGNSINAVDIGKKLGARNILVGTYELKGDQINLSTSLIDTKNGLAIWSMQYAENLDNIFALQNRIVNTIEDKLNIISDENDQQNTKKPTGNIDAYKMYLKGRASWNLRTPKALMTGIDFFKGAIAIDSAYAAAYAGIADCYTALGYGSFLAPEKSFPIAFDAATKALKLDSTLAEPHASLGYYQFYYQWDWAAAEQEFRTAISLNPNYALAYDWYGYYLTAMKRYDEAKIMLAKAAELDPLSSPIVNDMGFCLYYAGDYDDAIEKLQQAIKINPNLGIAYIWVGRCCQAEKKYDQAINAYQHSIKLIPGWPVAFAQLGNVYGVSGNKGSANNILDTLRLISRAKYVTSYGVAIVYAGLGETDSAFRYLDKSYEERTHWLVWLRSDPRWISLRSDKRFKVLVNKVGLPQ